MTNKELQQLLSKYPDDANITKVNIILINPIQDHIIDIGYQQPYDQKIRTNLVTYQNTK